MRVKDGTKGTLSIGLMCTVCIVTRGEANGKLIIDEVSLEVATFVTGTLESLGVSDSEAANEEPHTDLAGDLINCSHN